MRRAIPYALTLLGLLAGLTVVLFGPLATASLNYFVGGTFLAVAVAAVAYMIVAFGHPRDRGPDF